MTMFITQVLLRPQNLGNDKTDKVVQFLVGGVYNPKNLGNVPYRPLDDEDGVYNPKNLGNDKIANCGFGGCL